MVSVHRDAHSFQRGNQEEGPRKAPALFPLNCQSVQMRQRSEVRSLPFVIWNRRVPLHTNMEALQRLRELEMHEAVDVDLDGRQLRKSPEVVGDSEDNVSRGSQRL